MIRRLPREMGIWVICDGTHGSKCQEKRFTANVYARVNRAELTKQGWGRGLLAGTKLRSGTKRHDLCPTHLKIERETLAQQKADRETEKKRRDELKKAKLSAAPLPKKVRKKKGSTSPTPAPHELAGGHAPGSPSADSGAAATP